MKQNQEKHCGSCPACEPVDHLVSEASVHDPQGVLFGALRTPVLLLNFDMVDLIDSADDIFHVILY